MWVKVIDQETKQPLKGAEIYIYTLTGYSLQATESSLTLETESQNPRHELIGKGVTDSQGMVELFPEIDGEGVVELKTEEDPS